MDICFCKEEQHNTCCINQWKISPDERERKNSKWKDQQDKALGDLYAHLKSDDIEDSTNVKKAFKLMKKTAYDSEHILGTAIKICLGKDYEVYVAPYKSDFRLVSWEMTCSTDGTYTTDSDIYTMGSHRTQNSTVYWQYHIFC